MQLGCLSMGHRVPKFPPEVVASRLRTYRKRAGWSQRRLAEAAGIDQGYLSRVERGTVHPGLNQLGAIADALSVPWADLFLDVDQDAAPLPREMNAVREGILSDSEAPPGLRDLASDVSLLEALGVQHQELIRLQGVELPVQASKEGYVQLLLCIRSISRG